MTASAASNTPEDFASRAELARPTGRGASAINTLDTAAAAGQKACQDSNLATRGADGT